MFSIPSPDKVRIFFVCLTLYFVPLSFGGSHSCFQKHISDAIKINKERLPIYSQLSQGRSLELSKEFIFLEKVILFFSGNIFDFDEMEAPFLSKGVNLTCDSFVDMSTLTHFTPVDLMNKPNLDNFESLDPYIVSRLIKSSLGNDIDYQESKKITIEYIAQLATEPKFNCLTRHFLESMARIMGLFPKWKKQLRSSDSAQLKKIVDKMISSHLMALRFFVDLDERAAPLQADGISIFCQDVPHISFE